MMQNNLGTDAEQAALWRKSSSRSLSGSAAAGTWTWLRGWLFLLVLVVA
jgi:hypothetical protein